MKKLILAVLVALSAGQAMAATARWTGKREMGMSITNQYIVTCEYSLWGRYFYRSFASGTSCPDEIEVQ